MAILVKILTDDDGNKKDNPKWCLSHNFGDARRTVCTGECFGYGEGIAIFETKELKRRGKHGITCSRCIEIIKFCQSINL